MKNPNKEYPQLIKSLTYRYNTQKLVIYLIMNSYILIYNCKQNKLNKQIRSKVNLYAIA